VARYAEVLRRFPEDALARARLAAIYHASGQLDEAWRLAREALARDPRSVGALKVMMKVALDRGHTDLAQLVALRAQKLDPTDPEIAFLAGRAMAGRNDESGATAQYRKALALRDDHLPARRELLRLALAQQSWEAAAEQARAILRADPDDARVQLALGVALRHLNQPDAALEAYQQAERLAPGSLPEVHLDRAILFMKVKDRCEPALSELRRYLAVAGPAAAAESPAVRLQRECESGVAPTTSTFCIAGATTARIGDSPELVGRQRRWA